MSLALIVIVVMGGLVAGIAAYWPGIMIDDARWQYQQSVDNSYEDWHPVLMALVWHALMMVRTGPAPMLILQLALYWSGVALIAGWLWRRGAHGIGLAVACLGWMPAAFALMGSVTKDCLMAGVLLSATGLLLWRDEASAARRLAVSVAAFALLLVASALRVNAFLATAPLALLLLPRLFTSSKLRKALSGLVLAAAFLCIPAAFARLAGAEQTNSDLSLIIFDLGGITEHSAQSQFPPLGVTSAVAANHHCYDPVEWDSYSSWARTPCPLGFEAIEPLVDNGDFDPVPAWRDAILSHPVAYAQHRLDHFNRSTWFMVQAGPDFTAWSQSVANPWNFRIRPNLMVTVMTKATNAVARTPFGWPIFWIAVALATLILSWSTRASAAVTALAASAFLYGMGYLVVGVATGMRYYLWTIVAAALSAFLVMADRRQVKRANGFASGLAAAIVIVPTALAAAARIAG